MIWSLKAPLQPPLMAGVSFPAFLSIGRPQGTSSSPQRRRKLAGFFRGPLFGAWGLGSLGLTLK